MTGQEASTELAQRLKQAAGTRKPSELIRLLLECRGQDENDRKAWEAAKKAIGRWSTTAHYIENREEAHCFAVKLGKDPGYLIIPAEVRPIGAQREYRRLEERIERLEEELEELRDGRDVRGHQQDAT